MATKPPDNIPEWADSSNAGNYTGGPFAGQPRKVSIPAGIAAEGFRPGADDPSAAEHVNDYLNQASKKLRWLHAGTSAAVGEATVVERNSSGGVAAQYGVFNNSLSGQPYSLFSQAPNDAGGNALRLYSEAPNEDPLVSMAHDNDGLGVFFEGGPFASLTCHGDSLTGLILATNGDSADGIGVTTNGDNSEALIAATFGAGGVAIRGLSADGVGAIIESFADDAMQITGGDSNVTGAIRATGKVNAAGLIATGGPTAGSTAIFAVAGSGGGVAIRATGNGTAIIATGTGSGYALDATADIAITCASNTNNGFGLNAYSSATATGGAAISCVGRGNGDGIVSTAEGNGIGGKFTTTGTGNAGTFTTSGTGVAVEATANGNANAARFDGAGTSATTVHVPRAADPSSFEDGGMWYRDNIGMSVRREGATRRLHDSAKGRVYGAAFAASGSTTGDHLAPTTIATITLTGAEAPAVDGDLVFGLVADVGRTTASSTCKFGIQVVLDGVTIYDSWADSDATQLFQSGAGVYERYINFTLTWGVTAGSHTCIFKFFRQDGDPGDTVRYRRAFATVTGVL